MMSYTAKVMTRYTARTDSPNEKAFRIFAYSTISLTLILLLSTGLIELSESTSHALGWAAMGLLVPFMGGVFVLAAKESAWQFWRKDAYDLADGEINRVRENSPSIHIPLSQINFIGESRRGLIVRGGEPQKWFLIPRSIEDFEGLKRELSACCEVTSVKEKTSYRAELPFIFAVVAYVFLFVSKARPVVLVAGVVALLLQAWLIFSMRKVWAKTGSPKLVPLFFLASWLILGWLVYHRACATS